MHITTRSHGEAIVVDISGRDPGARPPSLADVLARLESGGHRRIVLNYEACEYMDSAALGELVACNVRARQMGHPLKLTGVQPRLHDLLRITRLRTEFEIFDSVDAALASAD